VNTIAMLGGGLGDGRGVPDGTFVDRTVGDWGAEMDGIGVPQPASRRQSRAAARVLISDGTMLVPSWLRKGSIQPGNRRSGVGRRLDAASGSGRIGGRRRTPTRP
jgi:hypothetical protein